MLLSLLTALPQAPVTPLEFTKNERGEVIEWVQNTEGIQAEYFQNQQELNRGRSYGKGETPEHLKNAEERLRKGKVSHDVQVVIIDRAEEEKDQKRVTTVSLSASPFFSQLNAKNKSTGAKVRLNGNNNSRYNLSASSSHGYCETSVYLEGSYYDIEPGRGATANKSEFSNTDFGVTQTLMNKRIAPYLGLHMQSDYFIAGTTSNVEVFNAQFLTPELGLKGSHGNKVKFNWDLSYLRGFNIDNSIVSVDDKNEGRLNLEASYDYKKSIISIGYGYEYSARETSEYDFKSHEHGLTLKYAMRF